MYKWFWRGRFKFATANQWAQDRRDKKEKKENALKQCHMIYEKIVSCKLADVSGE